MKLNRRNTLIGLGTIVAGGGAALGTGAFSSVEADRDVSLETTGDSDALLQLNVSSNELDGQGGDDDVISIDGNDLNLDALTTFESGLEVGNGGENDIDLEINDGEVGSSGADLIRSSASELSSTDSAGLYLIFSNASTSSSPNTVTVTTSQTLSSDAETADIVINTLGEANSGDVFTDSTETILFEANESSTA